MQKSGIALKRNLNYKNRNLILAFVFSITIATFLLLSAFLNIHSYKNNYLDTAAKNNVAVAYSVVGQLEYTLKYGKTLDNYYGIENVFNELRSYCTYAEQMYIADKNGKIIYSDNSFVAVDTAKLETHLNQVKDTVSSDIWNEDGRQHILLPINPGETVDVVAVLGIIYKTDFLENRISFYEKKIYINAFWTSIASITLLLLLFFMFRKKLDQKNSKKIMFSVVLLSNVVFGVLLYSAFSNGYLEIARRTADTFGIKLTEDIRRVVSQGVPYEELHGIDRYFEEILGNTEQLDSIQLEIDDNNSSDSRIAKDSNMVYSLPADSNKQTASLIITPSEGYIGSKLRDLILRTAVSVITSIMIAGEVISFIQTLLMEKRKKVVSQEEKRLYQPLGIVRGLSFFYALFQYMAIAFVSIVLASIYSPIVILGYQLPYSIVMGLPLSIQILTSVFTSWLSGVLILRKGWKPVAVTGVLIMSIGTMVAAISREPYLFLGAQVIIGTGLGLSKTAFDVYAVVCAPDHDMERYTANSNAGITVGMSCSSAIGAVIAGSLGYSGAYLAMGIIGGVVALLLIILGLNIVEKSREAENPKPKNISNSQGKRYRNFDIRFLGYLIFMVLPYFFIMMFVDYFFPVYAHELGIGTEVIGYIFLLYGMCTSYIGVPMCTALAKRISGTVLMTVFLGFTGIGIMLFSVRNIFFLSIVLVIVIAMADGVMPSQQVKYVYSLRFSQQKGFSKAISIEGIFSSGIRGVAPIVFGYVMILGNIGLFAVAVLILTSAALFALFDKVGKKREGKHE